MHFTLAKPRKMHEKNTVLCGCTLHDCERVFVAELQELTLFIKAKERFVVSVAASSPHGVICPPRSQSKRLSCTCLLAGVYHKFLLP